MCVVAKRIISWIPRRERCFSRVDWAPRMSLIMPVNWATMPNA